MKGGEEERGRKGGEREKKGLGNELQTEGDPKWGCRRRRSRGKKGEEFGMSKGRMEGKNAVRGCRDGGNCTVEDKGTRRHWEE